MGIFYNLFALWISSCLLFLIMGFALNFGNLAKEDGLDLESEEEAYKIWLKKDKVKNYEYDLDRTIEEELKERVSEVKPKEKRK